MNSINMNRKIHPSEHVHSKHTHSKNRGLLLAIKKKHAGKDPHILSLGTRFRDLKQRDINYLSMALQSL
jgi:hypothetical protein